MARYVDAIDLPLLIEESFDYRADFRHTSEWDPRVEEARLLAKVKFGLGSRSEGTISFLARHIPLEYGITEFERPSHLVLTGGRLLGSLRRRAGGNPPGVARSGRRAPAHFSVIYITKESHDERTSRGIECNEAGSGHPGS